MLLTIEASDIHEAEQILLLLKNLNLKTVQVSQGKPTPKPTILRGDKQIDPRALFGIWNAAPRNIEQIRAAAWQRNWSI